MRWYLHFSKSEAPVIYCGEVIYSDLWWHELLENAENTKNYKHTSWK